LSTCFDPTTGYEGALGVTVKAGLAKADPEWLMMLIHNNTREVLANVFMLFWHTWSMRNKVIHEDIFPFIASSVTFLTRYMTSLNNIRQQPDHMDSKGKCCAEFVASNTQRQTNSEEEVLGVTTIGFLQD
jgi:hypothetical protein